MSTQPIPTGQLLMYPTDDGRGQIKLRADLGKAMTPPQRLTSTAKDTPWS